MEYDIARLGGTFCLALAFATFILLVRSYRPRGVAAFWYDLTLLGIALLLANWPHGIALFREFSAGPLLGWLLDGLATLVGCLLGWACARGIAHFLRLRRATARAKD
ncbi:hypothetical protein [Pseudomonas jinjuensis]|uniref:Uncharacterized protein n=1 Tax=Pseudomonas jinjuensis TaxID=198616 RepID=A0A1H0CZ65_9PSED|nr:hypothetical protein [Pseudomonas jinjuensis]SDN63200.1 hypothetical protein SAMN05216193_10476 [Pseudomonas jinjuensis]